MHNYVVIICITYPSVAAWSTEQMMLEMVQVRIATGVARVV